MIKSKELADTSQPTQCFKINFDNIEEYTKSRGIGSKQTKR
jgi:hypothetical protein